MTTADAAADPARPLLEAITGHAEDMAALVAHTEERCRRTRTWALVATADAAIIVGYALYQAFFA